MAVLLFASEHLLAHSDRRGIVLGLALLGAQTLVGVAMFLATLSVVAPETIREARSAVKRTGRRHPQPDGATNDEAVLGRTR
jgi:hypothetical protein